MTVAEVTTPSKGAVHATWRRDLLVAFAAAVIAVAVSAAVGFPTLTDAGGDNDSLLRLVEVRDLLAGQGWFDLHQYRMGPEGGFVMHWSRLVDAPIAVIIVAISGLTGSVAVAETTAKILWPALLFGLTLFFLIRASRRFGGEAAVLPAVVIGGAALYFIGIFRPGALDHHNVQLMLASASLSFLLEASERPSAASLSGAAAALMLAVGMETAPYVAVLGFCVAALFTFGGNGARQVARDFGLGLAGISALAFVATVPVSNWGQAQCDAFSTVQFVLAAIAGAGLAAIASTGAMSGSPRRRLLWLAALGVVVCAVTVMLFPQCLAAPYAAVDPRLRTLWLDHISEAQSLFQLIAEDPASVVGRYATPLVALLLMAIRFIRGPWRRHDSLVAALLAAAFVVSVWQVRGSTFSIAFAVVPLSAWIGKWREQAEIHPSRGASVRMIAVWIVSANTSWIGAAAAASMVVKESPKAAGPATAGTPCEAERDFAALSALPDTTVLAISNLGSPILAYSGHRVLSGPYHRNVAGDLLALDALMGAPEDAKAIVARNRIGLVAVCRGSAESRVLAAKAPDGLLAGLMRGVVPAWLGPIDETHGQALELYRVRSGS